MDNLSRRPAALFCLAFVYAGFIGSLLPSAIRIGLLAGCAILLLLSVFLHRRISDMLCRIGRIFLLALLCGTAFFSAYTDLFVGRTEQMLDCQTAEIVGTVERREYATAYMASYSVRLREADGRRTAAVILLDCPITDLAAGDIISCNADFARFDDYSGAFPQRRWYFSRGIRIGGETDAVQIIGRSAPTLRMIADSLRETLSARLTAALGRSDAALPAALLLGDRSALSDALTRDFRRLGVAHLLAISGFHFTVLFSAVGQILRTVLPSRRLYFVILSFLTVLYMLLCGMSESVVRAGIMLILSHTALLIGRRSDMPTALGVSAWLICVTNPASFYSVGLQLSVTAVLAMSIFDHLRKEFGAPVRTRTGMLAEFLLIPLAVQLMTLPLLCLYFDEISLLTPLAAILFTPLILFLLLLTPFVIFLPMFVPLTAAVGFLSSVTENLAGSLGALRGISVPLSYPLCPLFACALSASFSAAAFARNRRGVRRAVLICMAAVLSFGCYLGAASAHSAADDRVISTVYKTNDALILVSSGHYLLYDVSDGSATALTAAAEAARESHATELEALMLTHLHQRHIRGVERLTDSIYVRALILPEPQNESEHSILYSLREIADEKDIPISLYDPSKNTQISFGEMVLCPARHYISRSTHPIITLRIRMGDAMLAYCGTSWNEADGTAAEADTVILGAHGPIYKKEFSLHAGTAILARADSADYLKSPLAPPRISDNTVILRFKR